MAGADCDWDQLTANLVMSVSADRAEYYIVAENQESPHSPSSRTARSLVRFIAAGGYKLHSWPHNTMVGPDMSFIRVYSQRFVDGITGPVMW